MFGNGRFAPLTSATIALLLSGCSSAGDDGSGDEPAQDAATADVMVDVSATRDAGSDAGRSDASLGTARTDGGDASAVAQEAGPVSPPVDAGAPPQDDAGAGLDPAYFDSNLPADSAFLHANPDFSLVSKSALDKLIADAIQQESYSLIVSQNDVVITEKYFGTPAHVDSVMSVTKSITSLAVGALVEDGKIASVDVPVSTYYPEWGVGEKAAVTLRHLLTMTSGLVDDPSFFSQGDLLAFARAQPLSATPGTLWSYSNEGVMLFAGIVEQAAGMPIDQFVAQRYWTPLGITDWSWDPDLAGNIQTPGGLYLSPRDLLRIGALGLHDGEWKGTSLIDSDWIDQSGANETPLQVCYGYLWWVVREGCNGVDFGTGVPGSVVHGYFADGYGGNYVDVIPAAHLVAVRTHLPDPETVAEVEKTDFPLFAADVTALQLDAGLDGGD